MPAISEVMNRDLLSVSPADSVVDTARRMRDRHVGAVVVLDGGRLAGILTERDLLRVVASGALDGETVADWMTSGPETVDPDETTGQAAALMIHGGFRHLPVVEGGAVVGIVSIRDLMRLGLGDETPRGA